MEFKKSYLHLIEIGQQDQKLLVGGGQTDFQTDYPSYRFSLPYIMRNINQEMRLKYIRC